MSVILASDSDFEQQLIDNKKIIVKYFAGWCGACRLFGPKYKRLSNDSRFEGVTFLEVDAEKNELARKAGEVSNLPFFAVFKDGNLLEGKATAKEEAVIEMIESLN